MLFSKEHEWINQKDNLFKLGITDFAQNELGEIVFVEFSEIGNHFATGDEIAVVESVKAASEIYAPLNCTIVSVNNDLIDAPQLINEDPHGAGWILEIEIDDPSSINNLMDEEGYKNFISSL
jgi:glycine cleavage system H protein